LGQAAPTLPLVIGICKFPALVSCFGTDGCLPRLDHAPTQGEHGGWLNNVSSVCGSGSSAPSMSVGDSIPLNEGTTTPNLKAVQDCVAAGIHEFVVPIVDVPCGGQFQQTHKMARSE